MNYEKDMLNTKVNNDDIIRQKETAIGSLTKNVEKLHSDVAKNLEEIRLLAVERNDLSNYITS